MSDPKGDPKSDAKADARTGEVRSESWIEAGLEEIARTGVALLEAMLQHWSAGRIAAIERHTSLDGTSARERLKALIPQYAERVNTEGMAVELAIRQWARSDELAAGAAAHVDAARLKNVGNLFRATGLGGEEADARAFLFYCFVFGQGLLFLERGPRKRAQLVAKSAETVLRDL
jgi:AcrR family transcriptional regulator